MDIGNYISHSEEANMTWRDDLGYFAKRNIKAGEELLANYRELPEPPESRDPYYQ